jgi:hypothetical protein
MTTPSKLIKICKAELLWPTPFLSTLLLANKAELYFHEEDRRKYTNEALPNWERNATFLLLILESEGA